MAKFKVATQAPTDRIDVTRLLSAVEAIETFQFRSDDRFWVMALISAQK